MLGCPNLNASVHKATFACHATSWSLSQGLSLAELGRGTRGDPVPLPSTCFQTFLLLYAVPWTEAEGTVRAVSLGAEAGFQRPRQPSVQLQ